VVRVTVGSSGTLVILVYGTNPNRCETCVLNVVKVLPDGVPGSTTPVGNKKELGEGEKRRSTRSDPRACKRLGLHQLEAHNGP